MRKIFILIFVLLLLTPAVVWLAGLDLGLQVDRIGLKPPRIDRYTVFENEYYRSFDQYFNDSFSLRSPLLLAKRWLDFRIFQTTDVEGIHVGNEGWLYSRQSIDDYRKEACNERQDIQRLVLELHAVEKIIEATGRRFFFIVAPGKSSIYPEFVGSLPQSPTCSRSRYDLFLEAVEAHPLKGFVRLDQHLSRAKYNDTLLYDRAGSIWNGMGAKVVSEAIRAQIIKDRQKNVVFNHEGNTSLEYDDLKKRLMGYIGGADEFSVMHLSRSAQSGLSHGIVYGDDFLKNLIPYLAQLFDKLDVIRSDSLPSRQYGEDLSAGDIILFERVESELATARIEIDKILSIFESQARISDRYPLNLETIVPGANISLNNGPGGLEIKSVGAQSVFKFKSIPVSDAKIFRMLKLTIEASHLDLMTVKYVAASPIAFSKPLKSGITELYLPLPFQAISSLNIHPGNKAGVLILRSAEILAFTDAPVPPEPLPKKMLVAKTDLKEITPLPLLDTDTFLTKSNPETDISPPKLQGRNPDTDAKSVPPADVEALRLKRLRMEGSTPARENNPKPEESKEPVSVAKIARDNPDNMPNNTAALEIPSKTTEETIPKTPSIALTDFDDGRIFQRKGQSAQIVVSGTYQGNVEAIEARVVRSNTLEEVLTWTVVDASPRNGIFVGQLADVPQGGWYNIQVRSHSDHSIAVDGKHKWGVGMLIACLGQSNMKEWFYTGKNLKPHSLLRKFSDRGWSKFGQTGNAAIAFGNRIIDRLGIPVGLMDYSVNGSGLRKEADWGTGYWEDTSPNSIYDRFVKGVSDAGGTAEFVIWIQGEADAARGSVTMNEYAESLEHFITNQVRSDVANGSSHANLPFLVVMMIKRPGGKNVPHQDIRNAQRYVVDNVTDCYLAATTLDLKNHGRQHLTPKAYISMGNRVAQTVLYVLGLEAYYRGPGVAKVMQIDSHTIEIAIQHSGGSDFKPAAGITGWEVIANGTSMPIEKVFRHDPRAIRIVLERPLDVKAQIRYLYGAMPDARHPVLDNSPLSLPLEAFQADVN